MPMCSVDQIVLTDVQHRELTRLVRAGTTEQSVTVRTKIA